MELSPLYFHHKSILMYYRIITVWVYCMWKVVFISKWLWWPTDDILTFIVWHSMLAHMQDFKKIVGQYGGLLVMVSTLAQHGGPLVTFWAFIVLHNIVVHICCLAHYGGPQITFWTFIVWHTVMAHRYLLHIRWPTDYGGPQAVFWAFNVWHSAV